MRVIMTDPDTGVKYKIEPFDNGLCFRVFKSISHRKGEKTRNGHEVKKDWSFTEKYPSSLDHAVSMVIDMMLNDPKGKAELAIKPDNAYKNIKRYLDDMTEKIIASIIVEEMEQINGQHED